MKISKTLAAIVAAVAISAALVACGTDRKTSGDGTSPLGVPNDVTFTGGGSSAPAQATQSTTAARQSAGTVAEAPKDAAAPGATSGGNGTGGTTSLPGSADFSRKVILNATMSLNVKDVQSSFAEANRLARSAGGYVEKSSFSNPGGEKDPANVKATVTLRVPASQYDATLAALRALDGAKVQSEGAKSSEVTEQYTDLQSRLRNLERTETQYLKLLEQAKSVTEILQMNDRLDGVRLQIEQIQGRLKVLDQLTEMTTIDLTLAPFPVPAKVDDGSRSLGDVFADAWAASLESVEQVAAAGIYAGVALLWLAVPVGLVLFGARRVFKRGHGVSAAT